MMKYLKTYITNKYFIAGVILFIIISTTYMIYKVSRRITTLKDLPKNYINLKFNGIAVNVCDGDGFRFFHTPPFRSKKYIRGTCNLSIRIAGIDAPEMRKYNIPAQPLAEESKIYLKNLIYEKSVTIKILGIDRYNRILATVYTRTVKGRVNVGVEMVKAGLACVYDGKDALYGSHKNKLLNEEKKAQKKKIGMWGLPNYISPMKYKQNSRK